MVRERTHELTFRALWCRLSSGLCLSRAGCSTAPHCLSADYARAMLVLLQCVYKRLHWENIVKTTLVAWAYLLLALLMAGNTVAQMVPDLHSANVPVANQGANALSSAATKALAEVLVKVSGSDHLLANPIIVNALSDAREQVQQYAYTRNDPPEVGFTVHFEFDGGYVTDLVREAGAPLWTANRPPVLAWVVIEDEQGRHFVDRDNWPQQAQMLLEEFSRRGVPVQFPLFDLMDMAALSPNDAWRLSPAFIEAASARYNAQNIVAGRLATVSEGKSVGDWSYFYRDTGANRSVTVNDLRVFMRDGANMVAREMAARYAVAADTVEAGDIRLSVIGVLSYAEYAAIARWLENLELVEEAVIEQIRGDRVQFRLRAQTDVVQLASIIEINEHLLPVPASGLDAALSYRWQK